MQLQEHSNAPMSPWMADPARNMSGSDNDSDLGGDDMEEGTLSGIRRSTIPQVNAQTAEQANYKLQTFTVQPIKTYRKNTRRHP